MEHQQEGRHSWRGRWRRMLYVHLLGLAILLCGTMWRPLHFLPRGAVVSKRLMFAQEAWHASPNFYPAGAMQCGYTFVSFFFSVMRKRKDTFLMIFIPRIGRQNTLQISPLSCTHAMQHVPYSTIDWLLMSTSDERCSIVGLQNAFNLSYLGI